MKRWLVLAVKTMGCIPSAASSRINRNPREPTLFAGKPKYLETYQTQSVTANPLVQARNSVDGFHDIVEWQADGVEIPFHVGIARPVFVFY